METKVEIYSKEFAEFYGIMLGDGCIYSNFQVICISGDSILDQTYHKSRVKELFINLFRKHPKFYYSKKENSLRTNLHSKELAMDLNKFGFPIGKKNHAVEHELYKY